MKKIPKKILARAKQIKLAIFDVDGVLTDGSLFMGDDGLEYKAFNARDGLGMKMLQATGVTLAIITGKTSQVVEHRMRVLNIKHVLQGQLDKQVAFTKLCHQLKIAPEAVAYLGDDVIDVPVLKKVGLAVAVADAHPMILPYTHWQLAHKGGRGAARELCELIMYAQGNLEAQMQRYGIDL